MGISEGIQNGAGSMGAATLTNVLLTPLHLSGLMYLVPKVVAHVVPLSAKLETKLKDLETEMKKQKEENEKKRM